MSAARPDPHKPPYVLVRAPMNTKDPDKAFSETLTYVEFWCPPDFCRYVIHGLSAELVSDRKSYDITCKTNDALTMYSVSYKEYRQYLNYKEGKFLKKLWCCLGGRA